MRPGSIGQLFCIAAALAALSLDGAAAHAARLRGGPSIRSSAPVSATYTDEASAGALHVTLTSSGPTARTLQLGKGKSALVELPVDARDVTVASPAVADVILRTPRRITVLGVATGQTDAVFFDGMGKAILSLDIRVDQDGSAAAQTIARVLPGSRIRVEAINNSLILSGQVMNASESDKAQQIAAQFVDKPERVLNMLTIAGKEQVMLKVRVVEVQRTAIKQLGFNMSSVIGQMGGNQFTNSFAPTWGTNGALLGGIASGFARDTTQQPELQIPCGASMCPIVAKTPADAPNFNAASLKDTAGSDHLNKATANIQAFERAGLIRTLAEPNLSAVSGEGAKFLVGGEFPVPTGLDTQGRVTVEFKPFGVGLGFTPVVLSSGQISLKLSTEVSELSTEGAFTLSNGAGNPSLVIPALKVRRAETTVELPSGGAMMIAGLLQDTTKQTIDSVPGMLTVPILGALFRSRDYQKGETELVIIVTPYLVKSVNPNDLQTPADGLEIATDAQTIFLGRLNRVYKASPQALAGRTYQGPYGYVIE